MFAIIGLGPFGKSLALALAQGGSHVLGIDDDAQRVQRLSSQIHCVALDSTDEDALGEVEITSFDAVVVALGHDFERAVLTTSALKSLGVGHVICQVPRADYRRQILLRVGANRVVEPQSEAAQRLACELMSDHALYDRPPANGEEIARLRIPEALDGLSLVQYAPDLVPELTVLAIRRGDEFLLWPSVDTSWSAADLVLVMGPTETLTALAALVPEPCA